MKKVLLILLSAVLLGGCETMQSSSQPLKNVETKVNLPAYYNDVWRAAMQTLASENYKLTIADKDSGTIQTDFWVDSGITCLLDLEKIATVPSIFLASWNSYRYRVNIAINENPDKTTSLDIKANIDGYNNVNGWTTCYTKGVLEKKILDGIAERLKIK